MNPRRLLPLMLLIIVGGVAAVNAITWTDPTYAFYGSAGTGPIYFEDSFEATAGYWTGGCVVFSDFNMASAGVFGTIGFAADAAVSLNVVEVIPATRIVVENTGLGNFTIYTPSAIVYNVTGAYAWEYDSGFTYVHTNGGVGTTVTLSLVAGSTPLFIIPQWFVDQGGSFFGVTNFFTGIMSAMTAMVAFFASSVANIVSLVSSFITLVFFLAGSVIYWVALFASFWTALITGIGNIINGTSSISTGLGDAWTYLSFGSWVQFVPIVASLIWWDSVPNRARRGGVGEHEVMIRDLQTIQWIVGTTWEYMMMVFNFTYGIVMQFVSLLWGLIP